MGSPFGCGVRVRVRAAPHPPNPPLLDFVPRWRRHDLRRHFDLGDSQRGADAAGLQARGARHRGAAHFDLRGGVARRRARPAGPGGALGVAPLAAARDGGEH